MTTVDEAREALLDRLAPIESMAPGLINDAEWANREEEAVYVDVLIAAVRAEALHNLGPFGPEQRYLDGLAQGRHESDERLRALREAQVHDLASALYETDPPESWMRTGTDEYRKRASAMLDILERERALAATPAEHGRWQNRQMRACRAEPRCWLAAGHEGDHAYAATPAEDCGHGRSAHGPNGCIEPGCPCLVTYDGGRAATPAEDERT